MKNSLNMLLFVSLLFSASFAWASTVQEKANAVAAQSQKEALAAQKASNWGGYTLNTTWQRCEMYVSRSRGNGKRVRVSKPWTCEDVTTSCGAVVQEGKVFASAACFYAPVKGEQKISLKQAVLSSATENKPQVLKQFLGKVKDFVVFALP